jgi:soluble lytic murein transglycosylase-like protein
MAKANMLCGNIFTLCLGMFCSTSVWADALYLDVTDADVITISSQQLETDNVIVIDDGSVNNPKLYNKKQRQLPFHIDVMVAAELTELEPALIHAVIAVESNYNPKALSPKGAFGLMQLMPETAKKYNVNASSNYRQNIMAGSKYLKELIQLFNNNTSLGLAAYNAGPEAVKKYNNKIPPYKETMRYVPKVLKYYAQFN